MNWGPDGTVHLYNYVSREVIFRDILHRVTVQRERLNPLAPRKGVQARPVKGGQNKPRPAACSWASACLGFRV